jgi:hypothetical protein
MALTDPIERLELSANVLSLDGKDPGINSLRNEN